MIATVLIFAGSLILLIAAGVLYVPLLCYIQGNLKVGRHRRLDTRDVALTLTVPVQEYCCHKIDKVDTSWRSPHATQY